MNIGFFGGGPQALAALERIAAELGRRIVFVHPRWIDDPIATAFARARGIPVMAARRYPGENDLRIARNKTYRRLPCTWVRLSFPKMN